MKQITDDTFGYAYVPLSVEYWRKVIGSHYSSYLSTLLKDNIIQTEWVSYESDSGEISRVKGYRVNPTMLNDEFSLIKYLGSKAETDSSDVLTSMAEENKPLISLGFNPELIIMQKQKALDYVSTGLSDIVSSYKNMDYVSGVPKTLPVLVRIFNEDDSFNSIHLSVEAAQKIAEEHGNQLFYYKDKFIIAKDDQLNRVALHNLMVNYQWQIRSFLPEKFNFMRNTGTLRVYSKLSNLPTALLPFIRIYGQYIMQADLKCSQFTIFGNLINYYLNHSGDELVGLFKKKHAKTFVSNLVNVFKKHISEFPDEGLSTKKPQEDHHNANDIYKFLVDSLMHDFYGIIRSELNLPQRQHGKGIAFRTVFAKPKPENELVRQFRYLYPSVISIINDFKEKYGYNQFAIGLQCLEAEIFIDHIWKKVKAQGIISFTRHDSLVFPISKKKEAEEIITGVFADFDFIYRVEYEVFNAEEIETRLVDETNYVDSLEDYDEAFFYTMIEAKKEARKQERVNHLYEPLEDIDLPEFIKDDYYEDVTLDTLFALIELDGITIETRLALEEDIANLQSNYPAYGFQDKTNSFIRKLVKMIN
jgi:hypothetical protein